MLNDQQHVNYLDGWRGIALIFLLTGHFFLIPGIDLGRVGVFLFFVLSGYLTVGVLFVKDTPIALFYKRRTSRIFPALIVYVASISLYRLIAQESVEWDEILGAIIFLNYPPFIADARMPVLGHIWSLSVEEHAYIILSVAAVICRKFRKLNPTGLVTVLAVVCLVAFSGLWITNNVDVGYGIRRWIQFESYGFGIFAGGAFLLFFIKRKVWQLPAVCYPFLFSAGVILHWWIFPTVMQVTLGIGVLALTLSLLVSAPKLITIPLSWAPLRMAGIWSYSIYLWQQPFFVVEWKWYFALPASLGCGLLSFYLVESPARTWLNSRWKEDALSRPVRDGNKVSPVSI